VEILVLTVSDRASSGEYDDRSGPAIKSILSEAFPRAVIQGVTVPDEKPAILKAFASHADKDFIITVGGTGLSQRDVTPEATMEFCERTVPGIAEMLRMESLKETPYAALSRGVAGMKGKCIIINLPGSVKAATFCGRLLVPLLPHALAMRDGKGH
jgi:molybdopterin adenylyltransferase